MLNLTLWYNNNNFLIIMFWYMLWYHCFILLYYYYYYYLNYYIMRYVMVNVYNVRLRNTMWVLREYEREMRGRPSFSVDEHEYFTDMSGAFSWISWGRLWYRKWKRRMKEQIWMILFGLPFWEKFEEMKMRIN